MKIYDVFDGKKVLLEVVEVHSIDDIHDELANVLRDLDIEYDKIRVTGSEDKNIAYVDFGDYERCLMIEEENVSKYLFEEE